MAKTYPEQTIVRVYSPAAGRLEHVVRYRVETHAVEISRMIRRAASNKGGRCHDGPITITIHPDDHAAVQARLKGGDHAPKSLA